MKYIFTLFLVLFSVQIFAKDRIYQGRFSGAIRGYDPVAYFTQSDAIRGNKKITYQYRDAKWRFISEENRELFKANPEKYVPQYGGYCAKAMSDDRFLKIDPRAWTIIDDKLYLNYSPKTKTIWKQERAGLIEQADEFWTVHLDKTFNELPKVTNAPIEPSRIIQTNKAVKTN